jgi:hypothetical protein
MTLFTDAQTALPFVIAQGRNVEATIYQTKYPTFNYADVLPVVTEGNQWSIGTQFMTMDLAGEAKFLSGAGTDMPFNQVTRDLKSHDFAMLGSGWEWNLEEVNQASLYGVNLSDAKARSASSSIERKLYDIAMTGSTEKGWQGFTNYAGITTVTAAATGTGNATFWSAKTPAQILIDLNALLSIAPRSTNEVEFADTVALPPAAFDYLASTYLGTEGNSPTILERFRAGNVYTAASNQPVTIRRVRALAGAGAGGVGRAVAYRNSPEVLRFHLPMPRFVLPTRQKSIMGFETGLIARTGGTEVRLPSAMAYMDGVTAAP